MHTEPIRHHYIPQFILRNFCFEDKRLYYFDKQTGCISVKDTRDVFMARNLYRDEINYVADPVKIEKDLAEYEREVAQNAKQGFAFYHPSMPSAIGKADTQGLLQNAT